MKILVIKIVLTSLFALNISNAIAFSKNNKIDEIKKNISEMKHLIKKFGRDSIASNYYQALSADNAYLTRLKAMPTTSKINSEEVNKLYFEIDNLLYPDHIKSNKLKIDKRLNRNKAVINNGVLSGVVTNKDTGEIIKAVTVIIYDANGNFLKDTFTENGRYFLRNLPAGQYMVSAVTSSLYNTTFYPNTICPNGLGSGCQVSDIAIVNLNLNEVITDINIQMSEKSTISGIVYESGNSNIRPSAEVRLYKPSGELASTYSGNPYIFDVPAGEYYITAHNKYYNNYLYNNVLCLDVCELNQGTLITLGDNQHIENIDIALKKSKSMSGIVVDAISQEPILDPMVYTKKTTITVFNKNDEVVATTDANRRDSLWIIDNVPQGDYTIVSESRELFSVESDDYLATKYDGLGCGSYDVNSCQLLSGMTVNHRDVNTDNLILSQVKGTTISGRVNFINGDPVSGVKIQLYNSLGDEIINTTGVTDGNGLYEIFLVGNGAYFIAADDDTLQDVLYPNIPCTNGTCNITQGQQVNVNNLTPLTDINFVLSSADGTIRGKITDSNNQPIKFLRVNARINDDKLKQQFTTSTDSSGVYQFNKLPKASYQVYTNVDFGSDYLDKTFNNIICESYNCIDDTFTPINVNSNYVNNINFQLSKRSLVNFTLTSNNGANINTGAIEIYDSHGFFKEQKNPSQFPFSLDNGLYYFVYGDSFNSISTPYVTKIYGGLNCLNSCDFENVQPIKIGNNNSYNFAMTLDEYFYLQLDSSSTTVAMEIHPLNGTVYYASEFNNSPKRYFRNTLDSKILYARRGYYSQLYNGINCYNYNECDLTLVDSITPTINTSQTVNVNLVPITESISGNIIDPNQVSNGNYTVQLYRNLLGSSPVDSTFTNGNSYTFDNIPSGTYYIKVLNQSGTEGISTYYGDIVCEIDCQNKGIPSITLGVGENKNNIDITIQTIQTKGTLSGESILNLAQEPVNVRIRIFDANDLSGYPIKDISISTSDNGVMPAVYLPQGFYKLSAQYYSNRAEVFSAFPSRSCEFMTEIDCLQLSDTLEVTDGNNTHFNGFTIYAAGEGKVNIEGQVLNANSEPINRAIITFYKKSDNSTYSTTTNNAGEYKMHLADGEYYVLASGDGVVNKYIQQLYNQVDCPKGIGVGCELVDGVLFTIDNNNIAIADFVLKSKPKLHINVFDKFSNENIFYSHKIYDEYSNRVDIQINANNEIEGLFSNTNYYVLIYKADNSYQSIGYPDAICETKSIGSCDARLMPIKLLPNETKEISLFTSLLEGINGYVTDASTGLGIPNIIVDLKGGNPSSFQSSALTSSDGGFSFQIYNGSYDWYLSTDTNNEYINEIYKDIQCDYPAYLGPCDFTNAEIMHVPTSNTTPIIIDIKLNVDPIFTNGFDSP